VVLGAIFGLQFGLESEAEVQGASALFMVEWKNALITICFAGALGCLFRTETVRNRYSGSFAHFLFLMTFILSFIWVWVGLTIVLTTYVRFQTIEFSHLGFHCIVAGTAVLTGFITANIFRQTTN